VKVANKMRIVLAAAVLALLAGPPAQNVRGTQTLTEILGPLTQASEEETMPVDALGVGASSFIELGAASASAAFLF
jgi:hypothetical protein